MLLSLSLFILIFFHVSTSRKYEDANSRIVGGNTANIDSMPYLISLQFKNKHICGGALISTYHILTAAHCLKNRPTKFLSIRAGSSYRSTGGVQRRIVNAIKHPWYKANKMDYDIAILKLNKPLKPSLRVQTLGLPPAKHKWKLGQTALAAGWGYLNERGIGGLPEKVQATEVRILSLDVCRKAFGGTITERMLCGGDLEGKKDACVGDSGGPLVIDGVVAGIVSFGDGCARLGSPGVYTNVAAFRSFLDPYLIGGQNKAHKSVKDNKRGELEILLELFFLLLDKFCKGFITGTTFRGLDN